MALRIRKDGRVLCAAMHAAELGDTYLDDGIHYLLSAEKKLLVTEPMERHKHRGEWWWSGNVPGDVSPEAFYLRPNAGTQRPGTPDGSLATETRKPGSLQRLVRRHGRIQDNRGRPAVEIWPHLGQRIGYATRQKEISKRSMERELRNGLRRNDGSGNKGAASGGTRRR